MKKVIGIALAMFLLLAVLSFSACNFNEFNRRIAELEERLKEQEQRLAELEDENGILAARYALSQHKTEAMSALAEYAEGERQYNAHHIGIWTVVNSHVLDGKAAIALAQDKTEVDYRLTSAKAEIKAVLTMFREQDWSFSECGNFAMHIWVEETEVYWDDGLVAHIKLKNLSGRDMWLFYFEWIGFFPRIWFGEEAFWTPPSAWYSYGAEFIYLERNGVFQTSPYGFRISGGVLPSGTHGRLSIHTDFFWITMLDGEWDTWFEGQRVMSLFSNIINFNIL